jgi:hypothetical protein
MLSMMMKFGQQAAVWTEAAAMMGLLVPRLHHLIDLRRHASTKVYGYTHAIDAEQYDE